MQRIISFLKATFSSSKATVPTDQPSNSDAVTPDDGGGEAKLSPGDEVAGEMDIQEPDVNVPTQDIDSDGSDESPRTDPNDTV